ncbi:nickel pincer cofactor biosynthesis protein LarB [Granulicella tundricola]|uniref:1-(5-phosphoribosyl)-5-amino-4-imidazole-carboxylate (AIR) carboxylase n=1 Tax=Granulicella tundricola (strain ATCC BAA-1859 / DSM 23138 / MP5ACTX9) TaxID=1198114 RepID=E8X1V1_GRATM|nr:nickel pincer cofactor biosynthesis protein LarB [Granulicella tundricola]ADW69112.1 1-(5-phosphoribosyl)-5-amino-4-imidazole-carboxylate (AIR) carboxylase [Granulicella tundricola MP5ACTX9]
MNPTTLLALLAEVERGTLTPESAATRLASMPFEVLNTDQTEEARIDHHRLLRTGLPEVIYAAGKTPAQTANIFATMAATGTAVLATRATQAHYEAVAALTPTAVYQATARCITQQPTQHSAPKGHIAVLCAGTSDLPVAEEAAVTAELFACKVTRLYDVGVAGLPRLLAVRPQLMEADCVIVCAGMEGALPSVVGGLVAVPVIAVPTSVGYGASFGGTSALLGMLNSCSPNVTVVNIDNGFGAAYTATMIARATHPR